MKNLLLEIRVEHLNKRAVRFECLTGAVKFGFKSSHIYTSVSDNVTVDGYKFTITKGGVFKDYIIKEFNYQENNTVPNIMKVLGLDYYIVDKVINEYLKK